jgi:hypothetical protein
MESHMKGAEMEAERGNPAVRSKFDKSKGRGLPAPHLKFPGEVAKDTGSSHPGHNENGHKLPVERGQGTGPITTRHHTPGEMGAPLLHGQGLGAPKNTRMTDANVVHHSTRLGMSNIAGHEPDPVKRDSVLHAKQHPTGHGQESAKSSRPQHQDNHSSRSRSDAGALERKNYTGGRGRK